MKIGLLGGTFDPPHQGHLALAKAAREQLELDEVLFIPANRNPQKQARATPGKQRMEMLRRALAGEEGTGILDIEINKSGPSYTVETLSELTFVNPGEYWFLMGADSLKSFPTWKQPERILRMCRLGVALRGSEKEADILARVPSHYAEHIDWIRMPLVDISATELRLRIGKRQPLMPWIKPDVQKYIEEAKLYRS